MTGKVTRIEKLIKNLNKADFCKVVNSAIRSRAANETDIADIISSLQETIAEAKIITPAATPSADGDRDHEQETAVCGDGSIEPPSPPKSSPPTRKRCEQADPEDCAPSQGHGKRRRYNVASVSGRLTHAIMFKPDLQQDLCNLWGLCKSLRSIPREPDQCQSHVSWIEQLPKLFDNAKRRSDDAKCKVTQHMLEWRVLAIDVAKIYVEERLHEEERRFAWRAMGHKVHATRDTALDLLTGKVFGDAVNMYKLSDKDPRRKRVENWLRIGCPLLTFVNHFGFIGLIAPGMRISQTAFKAKRAGDMETIFVKHLIDTFESSKESLSFISHFMEYWVKTGIPPHPALNIELLTETGVRTERDLRLEHWAQPASCLNGPTEVLNCDTSDSDATPARMAEAQNL
ncbi:hypothetical protein NQ176_g1363 [Zarea fungicola]|uniref:Uncharacterized protein n=1 Tax=Zarea fungicola TaxID=93591 RepID=A0ACC1NTL9_9HYPO|nr:hypothetical protein NQ176_g1363 [Lecanicillium fungicola]